jgi:omega-6 fatty acid desaturase (delta-12 desaturase)
MPPEFALRRIRWPEAIRSFNLKLWDEERARLVPFPRTAQHADIVPAE